jgi:hypothetical protein
MSFERRLTYFERPFKSLFKAFERHNAFDLRPFYMALEGLQSLPEIVRRPFNNLSTAFNGMIMPL